MGKRLELAEKLVGQMLVDMGPRKFMIAVHNATAHGGALLEAPGVELDTNDWKLQTWHAVIDEMLSVSKWMEGDESLGAYFRSEWLEGDTQHGHKPRAADRLENEKQLCDYGMQDFTTYRIETVEAVIFELTGERVQILHEHKNPSKSVTLRGPLVACIDHIRHEMQLDQEWPDVMCKIARMIAEDDVTLNHREYVYECFEKYRRIQLVQAQLKELENSFTWMILEEDLENLITSELGVETLITVDPDSEGIEDEEKPETPFKFEHLNESTLREFLQKLVENRRTAQHCEDALEDLLGTPVNILIDDKRIVAGPGYPDGISKRQAADMRRKQRTA